MENGVIPERGHLLRAYKSPLKNIGEKLADQSFIECALKLIIFVVVLSIV